MGYLQGMLKYTVVSAPIGSVIIVAKQRASADDAVCAICLTRRPADEARTWAGERYAEAKHDSRLLSAFQSQLRDYFAGRPVRFSPDPDLTGMTAFQQKVLTACAALDYGQTATYGELARRIGKPRAARAVGGAMSRNPFPLLIPCHRVVGCNGSLGGFSAEQGIAVKRWLLDLEAGRRPMSW